MPATPGRLTDIRIKLIPAFAVLAITGCSVVPTAQAPIPPWPQDSSDLRPDPAVKWGRLENGLRYAILPTAGGTGRPSISMIVQVGRIHERGDQLGFAHFVEHMAFRDIRGFPGLGSIEALQRLGAGGNAETGPFETYYQIYQLPSGNADALALGLRVMRSMMDGIQFDPAAVESERGVIRSERRVNEGAWGKAWRPDLEFLPEFTTGLNMGELAAVFVNNKLYDRLPAYPEGLLDAANPSKLRAFYDQWYRPERMILTIAGSLETTEAESLVRDAFSSMAARTKPPREVSIDVGGPKATASADSFTANISLSDLSAPVAKISVGNTTAWAGPDSRAHRRQSLAGHLATAMVQRRLYAAADRPGPPFTDSTVILSHLVPGYEITLLRAEAPVGDWSRALAALVLEMRRGAEQGFTEEELRIAKDALIGEARAEANTAAAVDPSKLALRLAFATARGSVFTAAADDLGMTESEIAGITTRQCQEEIRRLLPGNNLAVSISMPGSKVAEKDEAARKTLQKAMNLELTPLVAAAGPRPFPYTDFGPPGAVVKRSHDDATDTELIQFANGVRANLKRTSFSPGTFMSALRIAGGQLLDSRETPGVVWRSAGWFLGGFEGMTTAQEHEALGGLAGTDFRIAEDAMHLVHSDRTENLRLTLQVDAAFFAHPAFREEGFVRGLEMGRSQIAFFEHTAEGRAQGYLMSRLGSPSPASQLPNLAEIEKRTSDEFDPWIKHLIATAPLEIGLIGDIDLDATIDLLARTFGTLPTRSDEESLAPLRHRALAALPFSESISYDGGPNANVCFYWLLDGASDYSEVFKGQVLASIAADRLRTKLRVETGETYTPEADFIWADDISPPLAYLKCVIDVDPKRAERVAAVVEETLGALARDGVSADDLERARQPLVAEAESGLRMNTWWIDAIETAQSQPGYGDNWAKVVEKYRGITVDQVDEFSRRLISSQREARIIIKPK